MPRALNEPVGLRASSLTQTSVATSMSGVMPSARVTALACATGNTSR
jgi:hypothetical protein